MKRAKGEDTCGFATSKLGINQYCRIPPAESIPPSNPDETTEQYGLTRYGIPHQTQELQLWTPPAQICDHVPPPHPVPRQYQSLQAGHVPPQILPIHDVDAVPPQVQTAQPLEAGKIVEPGKVVVRHVNGVELIPRHGEVLDGGDGEGAEEDLSLTEGVGPLFGRLEDVRRQTHRCCGAMM